MRTVIQRVGRASVSIDDSIVGEIGPGLLVLVGFTDGDDEEALRWMTDKILNLRVFEDEEGRMNLSLLETGGRLLVVSQFTLYGDARKGRRPSFVNAARPEIALPLYQRFLGMIREAIPDVQEGQFGAAMQVSLVNDGPVTLVIDR